MIVGEVYVLFNVNSGTTRQRTVHTWKTTLSQPMAHQEGEVYIKVMNRDIRFCWRIILCLVRTSKADVRVCIMFL